MRDPIRKSIKAHQKRRSGCKECKVRKVKCDESKPSCRRCIKRNAQCSLALPPLDEYGGNYGASPHAELGKIHVISPLPLNLIQLELLHHFTTTTCFTFSSDPLTQTIWRVLAPQHGLSHEFVLHSLLAVAGLHLAHLNHAKSSFYTSQALLWLFLIQGTRSILERKADAIRSSIFSTMIIRPQDVKIWNATAVQNDTFYSIRSLISSSFAEHRTSLAEKETCNTALEQLAKMFTVAAEQVGSSDYTRQILLWMMVVPDSFIKLVQERNQEALCVFAYYGVLLKRLDSMWFMEGWSEDLIANIYLILDEKYREFIVWPIGEIGLAPDLV